MSYSMDDWLPDDAIILMVLEFFVCEYGVDTSSLLSIKLTCKRFYRLADTGTLWNAVPVVFRDGSLNLHALIRKGVRHRDTEATFHQTVSRGHPARRFIMKDVDISFTPRYYQPFGLSPHFIREVSLLKVPHARLLFLFDCQSY
jgi:hypothetical protein